MSPPVIHMETEQVRLLAGQLDHRASDIFQSCDRLRAQAARLETSWQGSTADYFHNEFWRLLQTCIRQAESLQILAQRLRHEVEEWEYVDQRGVKRLSFQGQIFLSSTSSLSKSVKKEFKYYEPLFDGSKLILESTQHVPYREWRSFGRMLNHLEGDMKAGWVGRMDALGHTLHTPVVQYGVPLGMGITSDILSGDSIDHAIGSELFEAAFETFAPTIIGGVMGGLIGTAVGSLAGGVGAVPGAIAGAQIGSQLATSLYHGYQIVLSVGSVFAGALQITGHAKQAIWLQNTLDTLDIAEHVGDTLYDAFYDAIDPTE